MQIQKISFPESSEEMRDASAKRFNGKKTEWIEEQIDRLLLKLEEDRVESFVDAYYMRRAKRGWMTAAEIEQMAVEEKEKAALLVMQYDFEINRRRYMQLTKEYRMRDYNREKAADRREKKSYAKADAAIRSMVSEEEWKAMMDEKKKKTPEEIEDEVERIDREILGLSVEEYALYKAEQEEEPPLQD